MTYAGAYTDTLLNPWRNLHERGGQLTAITSLTRYLLLDSAPVAASASVGRGIFYLDPTSLAAGGPLPKLRLRVSSWSNNVDSGVTFTLGLYPFTGPAGAATVVAGTPGTVVAGSTKALTPGANQSLADVSSEFDPPAAGFYAIGFTMSGAMAASSDVVLRTVLQAHHVTAG